MKQIYVALEHAGRLHPVGVMRFDVSNGFGYFAYLSSYSGPPLDPINLDYRKPVDPKDRRRRGERTFVVDPTVNPGLMHSVFQDAMPGHWGMHVLQSEYPEIRQMKDVELLYWMGARTSGALSFFVQRREDEAPVKGFAELEVVRKKCEEFLEKLQKMGFGGARNPAVASHGGAMPKASYEDDEGHHWIAKFDRPSDVIRGTVLEHIASEMARRVGIITPRTKTVPDGNGGYMFLSERYDRGGANGRCHKISFMSLVGAKETGGGDYRDMFAVLKSIVNPAAWPQQRDELLRRMILNVGLNITDDHLRNHEMRLLPSGKWELAPAFDLVPFADTSPHQCAIFGRPRANLNLTDPATSALWKDVAAQLEVKTEHVFGMVQEVASAIKAEWPALVESCGLNEFNQRKALEAASIGCGVPLHGRSKTLIPLDGQTKARLQAARELMQLSLSVLRGERKLARGEDLKLSQHLMQINEEVPRLTHALRSAGHTTAADLMLMAPLKNAARAVLGPEVDHAGAWRDLEDAASSLDAVTALSRAKPARPRLP